MKDHFKFYNAHPQGKRTSDCVVRAYCTATNKDYIEARRELNRAKRELGLESYKGRGFDRKYFGVKYNWIPFPAKAGVSRMNGALFALSHPKGRYMLRMAGHLSCCIDGVIYDTWDCSEKCVYGCWQINENDVDSKVIKCCICGKEILEKDSNNAAPIKSKHGDRCCSDCNISIVIPTRFSMD
ncbi:hypothetical protein [uncultured Clostridium sp.]|uniref:hypothetical protein n=1 Tax=uncultured Clostridium sp. TaxID=59620 RepID=UPI00260737BC|nr:hypothetical protein [uncultured Clostridium sp.]